MPLYKMEAYNGFELHLEGIGLATIGNVTVTDYDCSCCGEHVGVHEGVLCPHQLDLRAAMALYISEELALPFDAESDRELARWRRALARMQECE